MKKRLVALLLTICLVLTLMPVMAAAVSDNPDDVGYFGETLPTGPDISGSVITVSPENAQYTLDGAYGSIDNKTIHFSDGEYQEVLVLARPNKFSGSNTCYYSGGWTNEIAYEDLSDTGIYRYQREVKNVTFTADEGVILPGFTSSSGHCYGYGGVEAVDYVRETTTPDTNNSYYAAYSLQGITFKGLIIEGTVRLNTYLPETVNQGLTFKNCTFTGDAAQKTDSAYAAIKLMSDEQAYQDVVVDHCTFTDYFQGIYIQGPQDVQIKNCYISNTTHNAIALQSGQQVVLGEVSISQNMIKNATDRAIRFGNIANVTSISINNNVILDSGDSDGELIKAGDLPGDLSIIDLKHNYWAGSAAATAVAGGLPIPDQVGLTDGSFPEDVSAYVAEGYHCEQVDENFIVKMNVEAKIGDTEYATLSAAIDDAKDEDIVTLEKNVTISSPIIIDKDLTIDGKNYTITGIGANGGSRQGLFHLFNETGTAVTLTLKNANLVNQNTWPDSCGISVRADNQTVNLNNVTINTSHYCLFIGVPGSESDNVNNVIININDSTLTGYSAVYYRTNSTTNMIMSPILNVKDSRLIGRGYNGYGNGFGTIVYNGTRNARTLIEGSELSNAFDYDNADANETVIMFNSYGAYEQGAEVTVRDSVIKTNNHSAAPNVIKYVCTQNLGVGNKVIVDNLTFIRGEEDVDLIRAMRNGNELVATGIDLTAVLETEVYDDATWNLPGGVVYYPLLQGGETIIVPVNTTISENTTVPADVTVEVQAGKTLTVDNGVTLTLEQGSKLTGADGAKLVVNGAVNGSTTVGQSGIYTWTEGSWLKNPVATVSGLVTRDGAAAENATVKLMKGDKVVKETTIGSDGGYSFANVELGVYSLVVTYNEKTITEAVNATGLVVTKNVNIPQYHQSTKVETVPGTPPVAADGLNDLFATDVANNDNEGITEADNAVLAGGGQVDLKITAEQKVEEQIPANIVSKIKELIDDDTASYLFLDLSVTKSVTPSGEEATVTPLVALNDLINIIIEIPETYHGKEIKICRVHEGTVEELTTTANSDGEKITISDDGLYLTLSVKNFSTYAMVARTVYPVTVNGSYAQITGEGNYPEGKTVTIAAGSKKGYRFDGWSSSSDLVVFANAGNSNTTFTMPGQAVSVTANWKHNGSGVTGGASDNSTSYSITMEKPVNGMVTASSSSAVSGRTITLFIAPDQGYVLNKLTVTDQDGKEIKLTNKGTDEYTFTMPDSKVMVKAVFALSETDALPFTDVDGHWAHEAIAYVYQKGLFAGTSKTTFGPDIPVTRGMIVTALWRMAGSPNVITDGSQWYAAGRAWAMQANISDGTNLDGSITREQLVTMLWRNADSPILMDYEGLTRFNDVEQISSYAVPAMTWAHQQGLISGMGDGTLNPQGKATRAEVSMILMRYCEKISKVEVSK